MQTPTLDAIIIPATTHARNSVIWLHGLGADGHDFVDIIPQLNLPQALKDETRFIFPHAPLRQVTLNGGMMMRAWFDIYGLDAHSKQDESGIINAANAIDELIQQEIANDIPSRRIVLAGFSQGGALALYTGLHQTENLAGIIGLSTYLPIAQNLRPIPKTVHQLPVFMAHGNLDPMISIEIGEASMHHLKKLDVKMEWHTYPIGHTVCPEEITDISTWLTRALKANCAAQD